MSVQGIYQSALSTISTIGTGRGNTEVFLKAAQIGAAFTQLFMDYCPTTRGLSRFYFALETANMHDFYRLFLLPFDLFFPIRASSFDLNQLVGALAMEMVANGVVDNNPTRTGAVYPPGFAVPALGTPIQMISARALAEKCVKGKLQEMSDNGDGYVSVDDFKASLCKALEKLQATDLFQLPAGFNLQAMNAAKQNGPFLLVIADVFWRIVDTATVLFCLNEWGLIDTAKWAASIGGAIGSELLQQQKLLSWLYGFVCGAYGLKILEASRMLWAGGLSNDEGRRQLLIVISDCANIVFHGGNYLVSTTYGAIPKTVILILAIGARGIGIWAIMAAPKKVF